VLPKDISTAAARALAEKFKGDPSSADWRHFGRLAGFTNRKDKHRQPGGHYPFVRLLHATGEIYENAKAFVADVEAQVKMARTQAERIRELFRNNQRSTTGDA